MTKTPLAYIDTNILISYALGEEKATRFHIAKRVFEDVLQGKYTIVKDFVSAYISGQIKIIFPTAEAIMKLAKNTKKTIDYKKACQEEMRLKVHIRDLIGIASGTEKSTPEEQETAINNLFGKIIALRNGERIEGMFTEYALEARIRRLEEGIDVVNNLVKEIIEWIMRGVVDK